MTIRVIHNKSTALERLLERSIINYSAVGGGGGRGRWRGINRLYARATFALGSAVVHKYTSCLVPIDTLTITGPVKVVVR